LNKSDARGLGLISGGVTDNRAWKPLTVFFPSLIAPPFAGDHANGPIDTDSR
jgi:hypothetical protein